MTGGLNFIAAKEAADASLVNVMAHGGDARAEVASVSVEAQNQASLAQLESLMAGVK